MKHIQSIVPACITPFNEDSSVNYAMVASLVDHFIDADVGGLFVNGSSAEFLTLTDDERKKLAETFVSASASRLPVVVHVGSRDLSSATELARHAESIGADAIATLPPIDREKSTLDDDFAWYKAVGAASSLPLFVYLRSDMGTSEIRPEEFLARMAEIPTFAGIKYGASNFHITQGIAKQTEGRITILTGPDELLLAGLVMGSDGAVGTTYNAFPNHAVAIYRNHQEGNIREAEKLQEQLGELIAELIRMGVVLAGTKAIMREQGLPVGQCRPSDIYGMAQSAHTEKTFTDHVTDEQVVKLMEIVNKYDMK
jgi:dihydrodipicolinate synthase/N-acetylneuraminate lyase